MISESSRSRNPAGHAGLLQNLFALASALASFLKAALPVCPGIKSGRSASTDTGWLLDFALLLCALGYVFLITGAVAG
jgi:membrane protein DedA with SNARE-associated domain